MADEPQTADAVPEQPPNLADVQALPDYQKLDVDGQRGMVQKWSEQALDYAHSLPAEQGGTPENKASLRQYISKQYDQLDQTAQKQVDAQKPGLLSDAVSGVVKGVGSLVAAPGVVANDLMTSGPNVANAVLGQKTEQVNKFILGSDSNELDAQFNRLKTGLDSREPFDLQHWGEKIKDAAAAANAEPRGLYENPQYDPTNPQNLALINAYQKTQDPAYLKVLRAHLTQSYTDSKTNDDLKQSWLKDAAAVSPAIADLYKGGADPSQLAMMAALGPVGGKAAEMFSGTLAKGVARAGADALLWGGAGVAQTRLDNPDATAGDYKRAGLLGLLTGGGLGLLHAGGEALKGGRATEVQPDNVVPFKDGAPGRRFDYPDEPTATPGGKIQEALQEPAKVAPVVGKGGQTGLIGEDEGGFKLMGAEAKDTQRIAAEEAQRQADQAEAENKQTVMFDQPQRQPNLGRSLPEPKTEAAEKRATQSIIDSIPNHETENKLTAIEDADINHLTDSHLAYAADHGKTWAATELMKRENQAMADESSPSHETTLLDALKNAKLKLPTPDLARKNAIGGESMAGELRDIHESLKPFDKGRIFSKTKFNNLDDVRQSLAEKGFNYETPADMLQAIHDNVKGVRTDKGVASLDEGRFRQVGIVPPEMRAVKNAAEYVKAIGKDISDIPKLSNFKRVMLGFRGALQVANGKLGDIAGAVDKAVKDPTVKAGVSNWQDLGGDVKKIAAAVKQSKDPLLRKGYEAALRLNPHELGLVGQLKDWYANKFQQGLKAGLFNAQLADLKPGENFMGQEIPGEQFLGVKNYFPHDVEQPFWGGVGSAGKINKNFKFSHSRIFGSLPELEAAGYRVKTKNPAEAMVNYGQRMNKAIESRNVIRKLLTETNERGEPLAQPLYGRLIGADAVKRIGEDQFVEPAKNDTELRYKTSTANNEALHNWPVKTTDANGVTHYSLGEIGFHPDHVTDINRILGRSAVREWYESPGQPLNQAAKLVVKKIDDLNRGVKGTMLGGLSTFHLINEEGRSAMAGVSPLNGVNKIDWNSPEINYFSRMGLNLASDQHALEQLESGLGGKSLIDKIPYIGKVSSRLSRFTFQEYIPSRKIDLARIWLGRNLAAMSKEIEDGKVTKDDVAWKTMQDVNNKFGGINQFDLTRNPTLQHAMQFGLLAPDFLESSMRSDINAARGLVNKTGRQPLRALATTAATAWVTARVLNATFNKGNPRYDEPFAVVRDGRRYIVRNEAEDVYRLLAEPRVWTSGRLGPVVSSLDELRVGTNWRGEQVTPGQTFKEFLTKAIPISMRALPGARVMMAAGDKQSPISPWEQFWGSQGLQISRMSPINEVYPLVDKWKAANGKSKDNVRYPTSKYQALRYALEDGDMDKAKQEYDILQKQEPGKVAQGFQLSLFHPFTGDARDDAKFKASLKGSDKDKVQAAEDARKSAWAMFARLAADSSPAAQSSPAGSQ